MNKQDLIRKIKEIDALTSQEKSELIELVNTQKRYVLVWEDKPEAVEDELREKLLVLVEVKERSIMGAGDMELGIGESFSGQIQLRMQSIRN